eukprot:symbB.v1.2.008804.t1/scaffold536.1/size343967/20
MFKFAICSKERELETELLALRGSEATLQAQLQSAESRHEGRDLADADAQTTPEGEAEQTATILVKDFEAESRAQQEELASLREELQCQREAEERRGRRACKLKGRSGATFGAHGRFGLCAANCQRSGSRGLFLCHSRGVPPPKRMSDAGGRTGRSERNLAEITEDFRCPSSSAHSRLW